MRCSADTYWPASPWDTVLTNTLCLSRNSATSCLLSLPVTSWSLETIGLQDSGYSTSLVQVTMNSSLRLLMKSFSLLFFSCRVMLWHIISNNLCIFGFHFCLNSVCGISSTRTNSLIFRFAGFGLWLKRLLGRPVGVVDLFWLTGWITHPSSCSHATFLSSERHRLLGNPLPSSPYAQTLRLSALAACQQGFRRDGHCEMAPLQSNLKNSKGKANPSIIL